MSTSWDSKQEKPFWSKKRYFQTLALFLVLALCAVIVLNRDGIAALSGYGYLGVFLVSLIGCATIVIPVPSWMVIATLAGVLGNPIGVGIVSGIGATIGEMTGYVLGYGGRLAVENSALYNRMVGWVRRWGSIIIFVLALIPNPVFDVAGAAAGLLRFPLWKFVLLGAAGRIAKHIFFAYIGFWGWEMLM